MDALAALRLQIEWGADEALEEAPVNRLRAGVDTPPPRSSAAPAQETEVLRPLSIAREVWQPGAGASPPSITPPERAAEAAAAASTLQGLRAAIAAFDGCVLRDTATNLVFAEGDMTAGLLLIGDPPGVPEDRSGTPFAGPAGDYLDRMLASISLKRADLLLVHLIPWRPPGDRPPSASELAICLPFLHRLIALARPRRLLLMGPLAARSLLPQTASRRRQRGAWVAATVPGLSQPVPTLPTFSAAELMRSPKDRRAAWADLRLLRRTLDADASGAAP
jgi:DNA polymerase